MTKDVRQSWNWSCSMAALGDGNQTWGYFRTDSGDIGERFALSSLRETGHRLSIGLVEASRLLK